MTNIKRQEVTDYLAKYNVPKFLIDLICEDESGDELVKGWHNAQLEYRYFVRYRVLFTTVRSCYLI